MTQEANNELAAALALALISLSAWKENDFEGEVYRAWKGYDFAVLDQLKDAGFIDFSYKAKSLYLTEEGAAKAKTILDKLAQVPL